MKPAAALLFACIILFACQQEPNEFISQAQQCRIKTGIYLGGGGMYDSATFIYDASGRIIKWEGLDGYYNYVYSDGKISARIFHDAMTNEVWYVDSVRYDAAGKIKEMVFYDFSMTWGFDTIHTKMLFEYDNNRLSRVKHIEYYNIGMGPMSDTLRSRFGWDAVGNMDRVVYYDELGDDYDSALYQFDASPNYFNAIHPHFFLLDPEFQLQVGLEAHFPYFYSKNNVTNINIYGAWDNPIDYGLDSTNKVTSIDMGGFEYFRYHYECP